MTDETTADAGTGTGPSGSLASEAGGDAPELSGVSVGPLRAGDTLAGAPSCRTSSSPG